MDKLTAGSLWELEQTALDRGYALVCGCDEAGAGPLAGPVYAGAVILPFGLELPGLNDSKKVTPRRRDQLFDLICAQAAAWAVAAVGPEEIDELDILNARMKAMELAIGRLDPAAELGDGVDAGGLYSVLAAFQDAGDGYPGIFAPGEEELEDEYPYRSATSRELSNDVDSLRAFVSKEIGQLAIQISTLTGRIEFLTEKVEDISNTVTELESRVSRLEGGS